MGARIFLTGGASGLGRALAERYGRAGYRVLIGDIHEQRGAETVAALVGNGVEAHFVRCDVRDDAALEAAARWTDERWGGVDIVVNNAGVAVGGALTETSLDDWRWIIDINLMGVVRGCKAFVPRLRPGGRIVNIASMAGLVHPPLMSAYNATKAAVVALSETLDVELADKGIGVSVVCPAFFKTNLTETMRSGSAEVAAMTRGLVDGSSRPADEIAELVFEGVKRGDFHILTHTDGKVGWLAKRALPHTLYRRLIERGAKRMMERATQKGRRG